MAETDAVDLPARACPSCGASVPQGRLSCPACGALLTAVSGPQAADATPEPAPAAKSVVVPPPEDRPFPSYTSVPAAPGRSRELGPNEWYSQRDAPAAPPPPSTGRAGLLSDLPIEAPADLAGWLGAGGLVVAALSILLPWRSTDLPGFAYFDLWGAATPTVALLLVIELLAALVALMPSRLPAIAREGFLPFFAGAFGLGLTWGRLGLVSTALGLWIFVLASTAAIAGGVLGLRRRDETGSGGG